MRESMILETSNSSSPLISIGGGGAGNRPRIVDSLYSSSKETWNTRWIFIDDGRSNLYATSLTCLLTWKGPRRQ
jgi:hypothetical protein